MKKQLFLIIAIINVAIILVLFNGCKLTSPDFDPNVIRDKIYEPTAVKYPTLEPHLVLYLDHSTCVIDANSNSPVFKALKGQLGLYTDTLCLIKGGNLVYVPNAEKSATSTDVFNIINEIRDDIPYSDIGQAVNNICNGNSKAILITDCEYYDKNKRNQDGSPYLTAPFIKWLKKGYVIYIVTEPYQEKLNGKIFDKKRFYFLFTDDKMDAPSTHLFMDLQPLFEEGICQLFKLTNSDISVKPEGNLVSKEISSTCQSFNDFNYIAIDDDWSSIREFVMKLDEYGNPLPEEEPLPLIDNLIFNDGENYVITDVKIEATNITAQYLALEDSGITAKVIDMSQGFEIDQDALQKNKLTVFLTKKIFDYLTDEYGGNLIRLDFVVTGAKLKSYEEEVFMWQSVDRNTQQATCVAKSIENALYDMSVVPMTNNRRVIHTVFIKTEAYK